MSSKECYDGRSIVLHWVTALLVGALWLSAQFIDFFPKGPSRWNMLGVHMVMGVTLGLLIAVRIAWRRSSRSTRPSTGSPLVRCFHLLLYALVVCAVLLGLWNAWARGEHVFEMFQIPAFDPSSKAVRKWAGDQHKLVANALLLLSLAHAAMGLAHHFIFKDGVLTRMLPERT